ncbi:MAG: DUF998 domain-containing protein [Dehalococcoidia bacterium]|nr:DUF998 domain-containing protein [Dehalococcoidia bacterium]
MRKTTMDRRQLAAWAGMIGPALFVAVFMLEGWLRPGYDPMRMFVSELSLGPRGWIQVVNFVVFGVLFLVFTLGVAAEFREGKASRAGPILLATIGISLLASGVFVTDPSTTLPDQMSWHGRIHAVLGALVFSLMPVSCFVFLRRFRVDPNWRSLRWWTLAAGTLTTVLIIVWKVAPAQPLAAPNAFNEWSGVLQRMILVTYLSWQFTVALRLRR